MISPLVFYGTSIHLAPSVFKKCFMFSMLSVDRAHRLKRKIRDRVNLLTSIYFRMNKLETIQRQKMKPKDHARKMRQEQPCSTQRKWQNS